MDTELKEPEIQTFVETAPKLSGKSEEEASKTGKLDRADEQVDALFAPQYQTVNSPIHRAVWDRTLPLELFQPQPARVSSDCEQVMSASLGVVREGSVRVNEQISNPRRKDEGST
jgi:hypothetical protein